MAYVAARSAFECTGRSEPLDVRPGSLTVRFEGVERDVYYTAERMCFSIGAVSLGFALGDADIELPYRCG